MKKLVFAGFLAASPASSADFCGISADQAKVLPDSLAGQWQAVMRGGIVVAGGKPHALPPDDTPQKAEFTADGGGLTLVQDAIFPAVRFAPSGGPRDFALPGESPLLAGEVLEAEGKAAALTCDAATLPVFHGEMALDVGAKSAFDLFALSPGLMVMVIRAEGQGQVARAVFDLRRGS